METLLARINEWGANLTCELAEIKAGQEELHKGQGELQQSSAELSKGQDELRTDMNTGLHRVKRQIQTLNDNILEVTAEIRELNVQVEKLEAESLAK